MRGSDETQEALFSFSKLEDFVPADHPLRPIRGIVNVALRELTSCSTRSTRTAAGHRSRQRN
jgi:hypothetical protein